MERLEAQFKNTGILHHAYLIPGDTDMVLTRVRTFADTTLGMREGNPDYYERTFDSFGVDEARELKEAAYFASLGERRLFVIVLDVITREAENALLKILEEPPANVHFFIIAPSAELFLPTVRSRVELVSLVTEVVESTIAADFMKASVDKRLEMVKKIADAKDKATAAAFLHGLEAHIHAQKGKGNSNALSAILLAERYIRDPGSSVKQLLEYVALSC